MKALFVRRINPAISAWEGWQVIPLDDSLTQDQFREIFTNYLKTNHEVKLADVNILLDNTYNLDNVLEGVTLSLGERFYSTNNGPKQFSRGRYD